MNGDSTSESDVAKLMAGQKADMVFTDPPYGMRLDTDYSKMPRGNNTYRPVEGDHEDYNPSHIFKVEADRYCIWGADWFYENMKKGFSPIVWDKMPYEVVAGPQNHFELCWVYPKEKRRTIRRLWTGFTAKEKGEKRVHPTQKPLDVTIDIMERGGNKVLDLFLGSGSTLIACEKTNRRCYGMEIDVKYMNVILKRFEEYSGETAERIS
jgi:DNA modification methylase